MQCPVCRENTGIWIRNNGKKEPVFTCTNAKCKGIEWVPYPNNEVHIEPGSMHLLLKVNFPYE